jgi:glucose/arabinose dehydrogenase
MRSYAQLVGSFTVLALASSAVAIGPIAGSIPKGPAAIELAPVASGLVAPGTLLSFPDGSGRRVIVDQPGTIRIMQGNSLLATPMLDIRSSSSTPRVVPLSASYDERGLLGFTFDPGFANPASPGYRRVFTYASEVTAGTSDYPQVGGTPNHQSSVASWRVSASDPNVIDPTSRVELLRFDEPQSNHNGGDLAFGPDGMLYISTGDGGNANDVGTGHNTVTGNAQDTTTPLGKILRIDVNGSNSANGKYGIPASNPFSSGAGGLKEIYAHGFRNPYRFSFDGSDLYVADVGQNNVEEIDRVVAGGNYGWRFKEGSFYFDPANPNTLSSTPIAGVTPSPLPSVIDPIAQYDHDDGAANVRISIIGGFVYRGTALPGLNGKYIFGDFSSAFNTANGGLYYADLTTGEIRQLILGSTDRALGLYVKGIGIDESGELYLLGSSLLGPSGTTGVVLKLVAVPEPTSIALFGGTALLLRRRVRRG